ncbi:MAG: serine hydrolase domain-containing protein, partial [Bacteroidota bacterium]
YLGIVDLWFRDFLTQSQMMNIITKIEELRFAPGEYFYYSNANYILLAAIIEKASGASYSSYLAENIFRPLEMENTIVIDDVYKTIKNRAIGYQEEEGTFYKTHFHALTFAGDGQILTTPRDMHKWHLNLKKASIGSPALWKKMHTKANLNDGTAINYGLGVEFETHNGYDAVGFDGMSVGGFVAKYLHFPALDMAFFTTQNKFEWDFRERFFQLVDLYVPATTSTDEALLYKEIKLSNEELEKYEGNYLFYYNDEDRKANTIKLKKGTLRILTLDGDELGKLQPIGKDEFIAFIGDGKALVKFQFSGDTKQYTYDDLEQETPWLFQAFEPYEHSEAERKEVVGQYLNKDFQVSKEIRFEDGILYYYYKNGAWKDELTSLSKELMEIPMSPIEFIRNDKNEITGFLIMGLMFEKI